jgi:PKD repeat protein
MGCWRDTAPRRSSAEAQGVHGTALALMILALGSYGDDNSGPSDPTPNPNPNPNQNPTASFAPTCSLLACTFADSSTDDEAVTAWRWDFGDSSDSSTEQNPIHRYATEGQYRATLRVMNSKGATDSVFRDIAVTDSPECVDATTPDAYIPCRVLIPRATA